MTSETAISRWLRDEMPRRGYPLGGPRAGGISRLAEDAGIPQASMSRIVNGRADPSIESLRKLANLWKIPLGEMLVHAGLAEPKDLYTVVAPASGDRTAPPVSVPSDVSLPDLEEWERHIWLTPGLNADERANAVRVVRLMRGDLEDDVRELVGLWEALNRVIAHQIGADPGDRIGRGDRSLTDGEKVGSEHHVQEDNE